MLHEPAVLAARLTTFSEAPDTHAGRAAALRTLFEAAGCPEIAEQGDGDRRNIECIVRGASDDVIVVGVNQLYDSLGSAALLSSLAESLAAAPRKHTFRYVAFSAHETLSDPARLVRKPKGAMRWLAARGEAQRSRVRAMIHLGPIGYGAISRHPNRAEKRLACPFENAATSIGVGWVTSQEITRDCVTNGVSSDGLGPRAIPSKGPGPGSLRCRPEIDWSGAHDWEPFRRRGIPVFGVHSAPAARIAAKIDTATYLNSYRALAVFLALADEALAATEPDSALPPALTAAP